MLLDLDNEIDEKKANLYYIKLKEKKAKIELKEISNKTTKQNSYLHVIINLFAIEFGYNTLEAKTLLKRESKVMVYEKNGTKFLRSCADLDKEGMKYFIEWIREYSAKNEYYIPTSEEYRADKFNIDKQIYSHRKHLTT